MHRDDIKVGKKYVAMVSNKPTTVRVIAANLAGPIVDDDYVIEYSCRLMKTGREVIISDEEKFVGYADGQVKTTVIKSGNVVVSGEAKGIIKSLRDAYNDGRIVEPIPGSVVSSFKKKVQQMKEEQTKVPPHLIIEARAGTGKTTTLIEGLKRLKGIASDHPAALNPGEQQKAIWDILEMSRDSARTVAFVAFNTSIAKELKDRVPPGCDAMTMHSLGFAAIREAFGGSTRVDEYRIDGIICTLLDKEIKQIRKDDPRLIPVVKRLVELCKVNLTDVYLPQNSSEEEHVKGLLDDLLTYFDIDTEGLQMDQVYELVPQVLEKCKDVRETGSIDFSDMVWLPVVLNLPTKVYDLLLVDEVQDLNRCQQELAKKAGRRLVLCGDEKQSIYGFSGADCESMRRLGEQLSATAAGCITLPLTVTRRCGKAIVREANKIVADFEAHENNGEGKITQGVYDEEDAIEMGMQPYSDRAEYGDMILCRVNSPLVGECFKFIRSGRKANIQGRDVGQGLINTVKKLMKKEDVYGRSSVVAFVAKLDEWLYKETEKENAKKFPSESHLIMLQDKHQCLFCLTDNVNTVAEMIERIESVFIDRDSHGRKNCILLSSIHKAKGLEANRVFLLEPEGATVPHPMAKTPWQLEQEYNLRYVAITRAKEELVFVS